MDYKKYERIRPLIPEEVPSAIQELLQNQELKAAYESLGMDYRWEDLRELLASCKSVEDFKVRFGSKLVRHVMKLTCKDIAPLKGVEQLSPQGAYTYISNHRDIILDSAFLNVLAYESGLKIPEIAIGDNLLVRPWVEKLVKLNGNFLVRRNLQGRDVLLAAKELSGYMNDAIASGISLWIAQREGRAKDSNDRTQPALLKMLSLGGLSRSFLDNMKSLNVVPLSCSYEYDPCDFLKAQEMQCKRDIPNFKKTPLDDALNMRTGVLGYKGRVAFTLGRPLNDLIGKQQWDDVPQTELPERVASLIDREIHRNYTLYPANFIAWDLLSGSAEHNANYSEADKQAFEKYLSMQLSKITLPNGLLPDQSFLRDRILEMYANPAINHYKSLED